MGVRLGGFSGSDRAPSQTHPEHMPGLVGFIGTRRSPDDAALLRRMLTTIQHQPSYVSGDYSDEALGLHVAWTARAGNFDAQGLMWNGARDRGLLFCGEEYADERVRAALGGGADFGRAAYLPALREKLGDDFYAALNGWFNGLDIDVARRRVTLFNDRYGLARVYVQE